MTKKKNVTRKVKVTHGHASGQSNFLHGYSEVGTMRKSDSIMNQVGTVKAKKAASDYKDKVYTGKSTSEAGKKLGNELKALERTRAMTKKKKKK